MPFKMGLPFKGEDAQGLWIWTSQSGSDYYQKKNVKLFCFGREQNRGLLSD
jgi:hypothetical protein